MGSQRRIRVLWRSLLGFACTATLLWVFAGLALAAFPSLGPWNAPLRRPRGTGWQISWDGQGDLVRTAQGVRLGRRSGTGLMLPPDAGETLGWVKFRVRLTNLH